MRLELAGQGNGLSTIFMLGRRTVIDNADTGRTVTVYDPASNVVKKVIAKLAAGKKAITYATSWASALRHPWQGRGRRKNDATI